MAVDGAGFLGLSGVGRHLVDVERPKNWREGLLLLFPNGDMPLTAITAMGKTVKTDDTEFNYFPKSLSAQGGAFTVTEVFTDIDLSIKKTGTVAADEVLFVKTTLAIAQNFRVGHTVLLLVSTKSISRMAGQTIGVTLNGTSSFITFKTTLAVATGIVDIVNYIDIIGDANVQGSTIPDGISYDPLRRTNFTQIFRQPLSITGTMMETRLRTTDQYKELKREALQYTGIQMEQAMMWGEKLSKTSGTPNNQNFTLTQGINSFIKEHTPANERDFTAVFSGSTWLSKGEEFIDAELEKLFREGSSSKLAVAGTGALLGIQQIVKNAGQFNFTAETMDYGIKVVRWVLPHGEILIKRHPLFSKKVAYANDMILIEVDDIIARPLGNRDTHFKPDTGMREGGFTAIDGRKEEFLTEIGWQYGHSENHMHLTGVGIDG